MIKMFEGFSPGTYLDAVGVPTIGYGTTDPDIAIIGAKITEAEAEVLLSKHLDEIENSLLDGRKAPARVPSAWELDALISFAYNLGIGALYNSTLLRLHSKEPREAAKEFRRWKYAGGKVLPGLVKRRRAEAVRYLGGDWELVYDVYKGGVR
jgi:lysozyme